MAVNKVDLANGQNLIDLTNDTATDDTVFEGVTFHCANGETKTGTFTIADELSDQDSLIAQIQTALRGKAAAAPSLPTQEKTVEITENGTVEVVPDDGYVLSKVGITVNVESSGNDSDLPTGYTRCDFIQFDGTQLVDTEIIGNQDTQIRASFTWGGTTQNHLFGCASSDNTASITSYMNGSWRFGPKNATKTIAKNNTVLPYSVLINKSIIGVTGSSTSISDVPDFETVSTLLLGGARTATGGLPGSGLVGRVFDFRVWDGETPLMEMVPVTDGQVYRFWDAVGKKFYDSITDTQLGGGNL
jgi:hypothetical protein